MWIQRFNILKKLNYILIKLYIDWIILIKTHFNIIIKWYIFMIKICMVYEILSNQGSILKYVSDELRNDK